MRLDIALDKEQSVALGALAALLFAGAAGVFFAFGGLGAAADENDARRTVLARLEAAHRRSATAPDGRPLQALAPDAAFLAAPTAGLASAQLQAHVTRLVEARRAGLASSGALPATREETDAVRLSATFDMELEGLQALLHELETGTPYVFVEALSLAAQGGRRAEQPALHVVLTLRAYWRRTAS